MALYLLKHKTISILYNPFQLRRNKLWVYDIWYMIVFWIYIFIIVSGWSWLRLVICYGLLWQVLLPLNKDNKHWLLGEIDLKARHLNLYDPKKWGYTPDYHVNYYGARVCEMLPYLLRSVRLFEVRKDISNSLEPFTVCLADCPQQKTE